MAFDSNESFASGELLCETIDRISALELKLHRRILPGSIAETPRPTISS